MNGSIRTTPRELVVPGEIRPVAIIALSVWRAPETVRAHASQICHQRRSDRASAALSAPSTHLLAKLARRGIVCQRARFRILPWTLQTRNERKPSPWRATKNNLYAVPGGADAFRACTSGQMFFRRPNCTGI